MLLYSIIGNTLFFKVLEVLNESNYENYYTFFLNLN
jgi:hypothetical protein